MLGVLVLLLVGKFAIADFWGGISLALVVLMGFLALSGEYGINVANCLFYAIMALISGVLDIIGCVAYFQHSKYKMFDTKAPTMVLVAQIVFLGSPLVLLAS